MSNKTIFVGMSGGVDSSLSAALLKKQGHRVVGVFMKNWTKDLPGHVCPWQQDYSDALKVAVSLDIELKVYDFQKQYRKQVVDYMIDEYKRGLTPNPDIMCNQEVKFKLFLSSAVSDGADYIATGHYANTKEGRLYKAKDITKDQTYFLYRVDTKALKQTIFPVGNLTKKEVRVLANKYNLPTANKKDSVGICFVGEVGVKDFLKYELGPQPEGNIINDKNEIVGRHEGAIYYTIGQRHGLSVGGGLPYYVTHKDMKRNIVYVTSNLNNPKLWASSVKLTKPHFIYAVPKNNHSYSVKLRYGSKESKATYKDDSLILGTPQKGIAAGQSAVIYDKDEVIGGGIISRTL